MSDELPPIPDLVPQVLPGGSLNLLAGAPGLGKTALMASILAALQQGQPIFDRRSNCPPQIGYINCDRNWDLGAGVWLQRAQTQAIPYYSLADDHTFTPTDLRNKHRRINLFIRFADNLTLPWGSLLVVDPGSLFLGGNLLDYDSCAVALLEIRNYIRRKGYTLIMLVHSGKMKADKNSRFVRAQDQILGTTSLHGFTDTQMYLAGPAETEDDWYEFTWHSHLAPGETIKLTRDAQGLFVPYSVELTETDRKVLALLPAAQTAMKVILEQIPTDGDMARATVYRSVRRLVEAGYAEQPARGQYRRIREI